MDYKSDRDIVALLEQFPEHMSDKLIKAEYFDKDCLTLALRTYNELLDYKQKGFIKYYEENGEQHYDAEPFMKQRAKLEKKFKEVEEFIKHTSKRLKFHIEPPSTILKDFENNLNIYLEKSEDRRYLVEIIIGLKRRPKTTEDEKELFKLGGMYIPKITLLR